MLKRVEKPRLSLPQTNIAPQPYAPAELNAIPYIELPYDAARYRFYIGGKIVVIGKSGVRFEIPDWEVPDALRHIRRQLASSVQQYTPRPAFIPRKQKAGGAYLVGNFR